MSEHRRRGREDCLELSAAPMTPGPDDEIVRRDEARALRVALTQLSHEDRELLVDRDVHGISIDDLARRHHATKGSLRARLTRLRAELRLRYALAFRHVGELPSDECMRVLRALAAADAARLRALHATEHLESCTTCAELEPIVRRRKRGLAGIVALLGLDRVMAAVKAHPIVASTAAAGTAAAVAVAVVAAPAPTPRAAPPVTTTTAPAPPAQVAVAGIGWPASTTASAGAAVNATGLGVVAVTGDESFRTQDAQGDEVDVQLTGTAESPYRVVAGDTVNLRGIITGADRVLPNGRHGMTVAVGFRDLQIAAKPPGG